MSTIRLHSASLRSVIAQVARRTTRRALLTAAGLMLLTTGVMTDTAQAQAPSPVIGRWDLTVQGADGPYPSWLEVSRSGSRWLVGRFVHGGGSARPIARVDFTNGSLHFAIPPQWDAESTDLIMDAAVFGDSLDGTLVTPSGERQHVIGRRAPLLRRASAPVWGAAVPLFNGKDLTGWRALGGNSQWSVVNGELTNTKGGANLVTTASYEDFRLHVEVQYPKGGNSGIYLRGRYEVQVEDSGADEPKPIDLGAIYGFLVPNQNAARGPGQWEVFDLTLIGRRVTVVLNGKTIIADQTIPGITGGALNSDEAAPGPIYLQGDHGPVRYRNLIITPAKAAAPIGAK